MKVRVPVVFFIIALSTAPLVAGDVSNFVNLGFSSDSSSFMFGLYGVREKDSLPYAQTYIVNVAGNRFVSDGIRNIIGTTPVTLGQDGSGALYNILRSSQPLVTSTGIDHLNLGRLVYVLFNGQESKSLLNFRDFNTGNKFEVILSQSSRPIPVIGASPTTATIETTQPVASEAEFHLAVTATTKDGVQKTVTVGRPGYYRQQVNEYQIRQIILSPDEKSLVFVIEKLDRSTKDLNTSYMVETVKIF